MSAGASTSLPDFCRETGIRYSWLRHRVDYFPWTRASSGRLYVDPDEMRAYLATFAKLPPNAMSGHARNGASEIDS